MTEEPESRLLVPLVILLLAIAAGGAVDLVLDRPATVLSGHVIYELLLIAGTLTIAAWLWLKWRDAERRSIELRRAMAERQAERDAWRQSAEAALSGFASAVNRQLADWQLTPAEREVAGLLLKGRSHRDIAAETGRSERTVRQHAVSAYRKAGVAGRAELAAFFLNDLPLGVSPS